ncbi:MAG: phage tail protein [Peptostreptococcaceae bacterium]|nr:phage tail protein [Peptostreptococcaceae bacterium]
MAKFGQFVLTKKGLDLQAKVQAGEKLRLTRVAVGDGLIDDPGEVFEMTNLKGYQHTFPIEFIKKDKGKSTCTLRVTIDNKNIAEGFFLREIGIFAQDPDEGEILYCLSNAGKYADFLPEKEIAEVKVTLHLIIVVGNSENLIVDINYDMVYATVQELLDLAGKGRTVETVKQNADDILRLAVEMSALKSSVLHGFNANFFLVDCRALSETEEFEGIWNVSLRRLEV